jgi:beta-glucosidase/6-phospho-beta-glucosidase/beta-galactosidase
MAAGSTSSDKERLISMRPLAQFMFATGIENSYPTIPDPKNPKRRFRVDEMQKCGHYDNWKLDFQLVHDMGIQYLRYGPPYFKTHLGPGKYDWEFSDLAFAELQRLKIEPIIDLCHFGVPDWIGSSQNPDFPELFADYAAAFAHRFPHLRLYTPVNEIYIHAKFSAHYGWWNECLASDTAFVTSLHHLAKANLLAMHAILKRVPNAIFIQSESSEFFHAEEPSALKRAAVLNEERFLSLDLTYGGPLDVCMYEFLLDNGMTREQYHWFRENHLKKNCIMGNDYYITNEHLIKPDGSAEPAGEIYGYYVITRQYFQRYHLPVMHTETNLADEKMAPGWLKKEWANMLRLKSDGVPILGFTWYSLIDQVDWDTALREMNDHVNPLGLYDLNRKVRPVGESYKRLINMWRGIMPTSSLGLRFNL